MTDDDDVDDGEAADDLERDTDLGATRSRG